MPYIKKELREEIDAEINILVYRLKNLIEDNSSIRAGTLNYTITKLIDGLYGPLEKAGYKDYNEAIGMLECCKLEFYRKAAAPYEDLKLRENGAVLDIIHEDKNSRNSCSKENSSKEDDSKDPFYEFVKSKKWLLDNAAINEIDRKIDAAKKTKNKVKIRISKLEKRKTNISKKTDIEILKLEKQKNEYINTKMKEFQL